MLWYVPAGLPCVVVCGYRYYLRRHGSSACGTYLTVGPVYSMRVRSCCFFLLRIVPATGDLRGSARRLPHLVYYTPFLFPMDALPLPVCSGQLPLDNSPADFWDCQRTLVSLPWRTNACLPLFSYTWFYSLRAASPPPLLPPFLPLRGLTVNAWRFAFANKHCGYAVVRYACA